MVAIAKVVGRYGGKYTTHMRDIPLTPALEMGQHTCEVLQELLGLDEGTLENWEQKGVI